MSSVNHELKSRLLAFIRRLAGTGPNIFGDSFWYAGPNLWEPTVTLALHDLCKPGMVVFDVGGNMGGLTSTMSRLVGPRGIVCAFEASPRIIGHLQGNVVVQGHRNVTVYHRAVFSRSNEFVTIYEGDHLNDSIYAENSPTGLGSRVKTLALDDFCQSAELAPDLIKMDIEGAEYEAILGAATTIQCHRPHLLLEQQAADTRCLDLLTEWGYSTMDLGNYRQIRTISDYPASAPLRNVVCIHQDRLAETPYHFPMSTTDACTLGVLDFRKNLLNGITSNIFNLESGRYLIDVDFVAEGTKNNMMCGVRSEGRDVFRYHGYSKLIAHSYREWVIDLPCKTSVEIYFDFRDGTSDPSFQFHELSVKKLTGFASPLWASLVTD
jgi:FkbM family methyltransferase